MQDAVTYPAVRNTEQGPHHRVERQYASQRSLKELVRDLLRAHSGK